MQQYFSAIISKIAARTWSLALVVALTGPFAAPAFATKDDLAYLPAPARKHSPYLEEIVDHIQTHLGAVTTSLSAPDGMLKNPVDLLLIEPNADRPFWYVVTVGMSNLENIPGGSDRVELAMALPPDWCTDLTDDGLLPEDVDQGPLRELLLLSQFPLMQKNRWATDWRWNIPKKKRAGLCGFRDWLAAGTW